MNDRSDTISAPEGERHPIVLVRDGATVADSRDVAAYFGKQHKDVLKAIRELHCSEDFRGRNFAPIKIKDLTGDSTSHVEMTRDGFAFVVLGFTGPKAGQFKEDYIGQFNAMEAKLRGNPVAFQIPNLSDPVVLLQLLTEQAQGRLEDQRLRREAEAIVEAARPKVAFYDRFAEADGLYGLQNAGRVLAQGPNKFISYLKQGYLFYQGGSLVPKVQYREAGLFEVKPYVGEDGKAHYQSFVTPKGILFFAKKLGVKPITSSVDPSSREQVGAS